MVADHYQELDRLYPRVWGEHVHHGLWRGDCASRRSKPSSNSRRSSRSKPTSSAVIASAISAPDTAQCPAHRSQFDAAVTAFTIVPAQQAFAEATNPGSTNPRYLLCDWLDNDMPSESFDAAYAIESTEHMLDKEHAFSEAFRVLRLRRAARV
ncbi:MAG: methyltransferase domain-containing protein [Gemmataceae bacterium]